MGYGHGLMSTAGGGGGLRRNQKAERARARSQKGEGRQDECAGHGAPSSQPGPGRAAKKARRTPVAVLVVLEVNQVPVRTREYARRNAGT
jgi:hypothetical protein